MTLKKTLDFYKYRTPKMVNENKYKSVLIFNLKIVLKDRPQAHEKMFNINNHQAKANQNHNEIPPYSY